MAKQRVRDRWQVALYVPKDLVKPLKTEARKRDRAFSATVVEILRLYFEQREVEARIAQKVTHGIDAAASA